MRMDWLIDTEQVQDQVLELLSCHASQVFEWLPSLNSQASPPFERAWLETFYQRRPMAVAVKSRRMGTGHESLNYAEAFEVSDYGAKLATHHRNFRSY